MKKFLFAVSIFTASVSTSVFAQVDSTGLRTDTTTTNPGDTSQSTMSTDTTAAGSSSDSTSMSSPTDTSSVGSTSGAATGSTGAVEITDEDLRNYAIMMDSVESMKDALLTKISSKIKSNGKMKISRYNQLNKAMDDEAKLKELKATPTEIAFVKEVADMKKQGAEEISTKVETLANDFVGTEKYNKIKGSLQLDTNMRTRYDKIESELKGNDDSASAKTSN